jgi:hypothetical protein
MHVVLPHGSTRGTTINVHGHVWQRQPYVCEGSARDGLTGACTMTEVASRNIGTSPYNFDQGAQESVTPAAHWVFRFQSAGGGNAVTGDYLWRDNAGFGTTSGIWGILRVQPAAAPVAPAGAALQSLSVDGGSVQSLGLEP